MTFNVRYPEKRDGADRWELRRDILLRVIQQKNPDVIGTQELFYIQGQYIVGNLPDYVWTGNSRRGNREDEHMGVFYKRGKLRAIESGNFWLSDTPEVAGSQSWGASLPRMVTWALFEITATGQRFYFFNTHFHHTGDGNVARVNSAKLIASRVAALPAGVPFVLTGDFNAQAPESDPYKVLTADLKDSRLTAARKLGQEGTWSGFKGDTAARRIDWILYRAPWTVLEHETVTYNEDGRYPSDHYPVMAVFEY
ncbi:MAG: endonuclease/exonuclease/phosphatase family protein [Acidobacteria bacterium]|nr:endonuclease/exonuclease/phosphatase family protein [Acidobacteriota bacterium]